MKAVAFCKTCFSESGYPQGKLFLADYYDDGVVNIECPKGHKTAMLMQKQKFEMLLESGATALVNGFTLEACASFAAALERYYEFINNVICLKRGMQKETFRDMMKHMANQSERQLGAFMLLHALEFGVAYNQPQDKISKSLNYVAFRNAVIHKGKIPTMEEATKFATTVYTEVNILHTRIYSECKHHVMSIATEGVIEKKKLVPDGLKVSTANSIGIFSVTQDNNPLTFEEAFSKFKFAYGKIQYSIGLSL